MQEKLDAIMAELEALKEKVENMEEQIADLEAIVEDGSYDAALAWIEEALEYSELDEKLTYTDENVLLLHTNIFRTTELVRACAPSSGIRHNLNQMSAKHLTPQELQRNIDIAQNGSYLFLTSDVFTYANEMEAIIADAMAAGNVYFMILTNSLEKVPQSICNKMRVIQ